jgi:hypothetical protein
LEFTSLDCQKVQRFSLSTPSGAFPIDSPMPLTYHGFTLILAVACSLPLLVIKLVS